MAQLLFSVLPTPIREIQIVSPDISVADCVNLMSQFNIGSLMVMDKDKLIGLVTERDVIRLCVNCGLNLCKVPVRDVTYKDVTILNTNDTVEKAMQVMTETRRRHILLQENGRLIAIVSIGDLLHHLLEYKAKEIEHLERYIKA